MYRSRPSQWIKWSFLAGLPFLASAVISSPMLHKDVADRASANVKAVAEWATVDLNGRDATIRGDAPNQVAVDAAAKAVAQTYGVRTLTTLARIVEQTPINPPTADSQSTTDRLPVLQGTWPQANAAGLSVSLAGKTYVWNTDQELSSLNGKWTLRTSSEVPDGIYDVDVEVKNSAGLVVKAASPGKLVVDTTPPKAVGIIPTPNSLTPFPLMGTWAEGDAVKLTVTLADNIYELGKAPELEASGNGTFSFTPKLELNPGRYPIEIVQADELGNKQVTSAEIVIPENVAPTPEPAPAPEISPEPLSPPTVDKIVDPASAPVFTGTWPKASAANLRVRVGDRTYELGKDTELSSDNDGKWTLRLPTRLPDGNTTVIAEVVNKTGAVLAGKAPTTVALDTVPPADPVLTAVQTGATWPYAITGSFPEADTKSLQVTLQDKTYALGKDPQLTSDGKGNFVFDPKTDLPPGSYDLQFKLQDAADNTKTFNVAAAIIVAAPAPQPAPEPVKISLAAPTVEPLTSLDGEVVLRGTWPTDATTLNVAVGSKTYKLGSDANLKNEGGGKWSLGVQQPLPPGTYDVSVVVGGENSSEATDESRNELIVAPAAPAAPTVAAFSGEIPPDVVAGTWGYGAASTISVSIPSADIASASARNATLSIDGANWKLNLAKPLPPGTHDVVVETADRFGRKQRDTTQNEIVVLAPAPEPAPTPEPAPAPETPAPEPKAVETAPEEQAPETKVVETETVPATASEPFDCATALGRVSNVFPIRFEYDRTRLIGINELAVAQYAALLKDPRCATLRVEIAGHADDRGPLEYNQLLSEYRAERVLKALQEAGIATDRLRTVGMSKLQPIDPLTTEEARAKNRRVEFKAIQ